MKFLSLITFLIPALFYQSNFDNANSNSYLETVSINDIEEVAKNDKKKVIIKLSATWCKPCKKLSETLKDEKIQKYLDQNFHVVDFDIQTKESVVYKDQLYKYVDDPKMGYHTLAFELLDKKLSFPALLVLDNDLNKIDLTRGYKNKRQLLEFLQKV